MFIMSVGCGYEQDRGLWDRVFRRHIAASDWTSCKCHSRGREAVTVFVCVRTQEADDCHRELSSAQSQEL